MSFLKKLGIGLLGAVGIGLLAKGVKESNEKELERARREKERKNTPCSFSDGISYVEFVSIVERIAKPIKRLSVSIDGPIVYGTVRSQSGISTWNFTLDFNDWGHITGVYRAWSGNTDSDIPNRVGDQIKKEIEMLL